MVARLVAPLAFASLLTLSACSTTGQNGNVTGAEIATQPRDESVSQDVGSEAGDDAKAGITDDRILFGQSAAFTGPASELGIGMRIGIEAAFNEVNNQGGVHGRRLALASLDDAYEPEAAIANTRRLIEEARVFALVGAVGTPTSRSALPIAAAHDVPYVAPFTGASFLRDPQWDNVVNLRASYDQETEEMVNRLTSDLSIDRIAVMYQDDSFGRAGFQGVKNALLRRSMEPVAIGIYPRNTTAVKTALVDLLQGDPQAVILVGAYQPVAALISWSRHIEFDPVFITTSFVGSNALAHELEDSGRGVLVTQVVPFPGDDSLPIVADYLRALEVFAPEERPGFVTLEGYIAGRLVANGVERCGLAIDRACFLDKLRSSGTIELGGFQLDFGPDDSQGSDSIFLTVIGSDGQYHAIESLREEIP